MVDSRFSTYSTLSQRAREGDVDAEHELLLRVLADSRRAVERIVNEPDGAEDVLQDAMLILLVRLRDGGLSDPEAMRQFVYGVARRLQANRRRKELRRRTFPLGDVVRAALAEPEPSALTALLLRERRQVVRSALARMHPARDRLILYRLYVLDHDRGQIRRDLGLSMRAFERVLSRARARFRLLLASAPEGFFGLATVSPRTPNPTGGEAEPLTAPRPARTPRSHERSTEKTMNSVCFGLAEMYDTGLQCGLAMNDTVVIDVHKSDVRDTLWYTVGHVRLGIVEWQSAKEYDTGITPAVALAGTAIVEVHQSENRPRLFFHVGTLTAEKTINWGPSKSYDDGEQPRVGANASGLVVEVHKSQNHDDLWYHVGLVEGKTVAWGSSHKYTTGTHPAVALFDDGTVVEIHESENTDYLWYMTGKVDRDKKTISWGRSQRYKKGRAPVIACDSPTSQVIEIHEEASGSQLFSAVGVVVGGDVQWGADSAFDTGRYPAVAYRGWTAVQTHVSHTQGTLWRSLSLVIDRKQWMQARQEVLDPRPLVRITFPATHDSGAYEFKDDRAPKHCRVTKVDAPTSLVKDYALAQKHDIGGQLSGGIRYFDLRIVAQGTNFHAFHDLIGPNVSSMLDQVAEFLKSVSRELVILKMSHFCDFNDDKHKDLVDLIKKKIGGYLYDQGTMTGEEMLTVPFGEVTKTGPRVLIHYAGTKDDPSYITTHPEPGFFADLPTDDHSSKTDSFEKMRADQLDKLKQHSTHTPKWFLLSWTLTPQEDLNTALKGSLHKMSQEANRQLGTFCNEWATVYTINFLYVDFFEDARPVDLAILING